MPAPAEQLTDTPSVRTRLAEVCSSTQWADLMLSGGPYADLDEVLARNVTAVESLTVSALESALAGHPRIGERAVAGAHSVEHSAKEQAGMADAQQAIRDAIAAGNVAYEERFGHVYLVCASGRSATELLEVLRSRLDNEPATEMGIVRGELAKINEIRLRGWLAPEVTA